MRKFASVAALLAAPMAAQADLVKLRDAKLRSPFLTKARWFTDFEKAKQAAAKSGKPILIYFTRSYAPSPPCEAVEKSVLSSEEFVALARDVVLFCHVSSKIESDPEQDLFAKAGGDTFPHMIFTEETGRTIASVDRISSVQDIARIRKGPVASFYSLRGQAAKGDKQAKARYLVMRLQLGHLTPKEIQEELRTAEYLTIKQRAAIRSSLATLEVMSILATVDEKKPATMRRAALRMLGMMRAGRVPSGRAAFSFWQVLLAHADEKEDPDLFETALRKIKKIPGAARNKEWMRKMDVRLRALRFMKGGGEQGPPKKEKKQVQKPPVKKGF